MHKQVMTSGPQRLRRLFGHGIGDEQLRQTTFLGWRDDANQGEVVH